MAKYHINPETGRPGECTATVKDCAYAKDGMLPEHYDSLDEALDAYEDKNKNNTFVKLEKTTSENSGSVQDVEIIEDESDDISTEIAEVKSLRGELQQSVITQANDKASKWVEKISTLSPLSNDFDSYIRNIHKVGQEAFISTAKISTEYLSDKKGGPSSNDKIGKSLVELRNLMEDTVPTENDFKSRVLGFPIINRGKKYLNRFESNKKQMEITVGSLEKGKSLLDQENQKLRIERDQISHDVGILQENYALLSAMDKKIVAKIQEERANGNNSMAKALEQKALFNVRQRRQDVMTQTAASIQSYMAMSMIEENNIQLIQNVDRTATTTTTAISTQMRIAQALANQKKVADGIDAMNEAATKAIQSNSKLLDQNGEQIRNQSVNASISIEALKNSFEKTFQAYDKMDKFNAESAYKLEESIGQLEEVVNRSKEYAFERKERLQKELGTGNNDILSIEE